MDVAAAEGGVGDVLIEEDDPSDVVLADVAHHEGAIGGRRTAESDQQHLTDFFTE